MNVAIYYGYADVLVPKPEPKTILEAIDKYKATFIPAVPTLYNGMINFPELKKYSLKYYQRVLLGRCPDAYGDHEDFREAYRGSNL